MFTCSCSAEHCLLWQLKVRGEVDSETKLAFYVMKDILVVQNANDESTSVISAILMSLSTGVFLHVTFLSLIPSEFSTDNKAHCEVNLDEEPIKGHDPFNKEDCVIDSDIENSSCLASFFLLLDQNQVALTLLKALFFVFGWLTLSLLTLLTSGHHH